MKISFEISRQIEEFLSGQLGTGESMLFRAKMLLDPALRLQVALQQKVYALVNLYGRKKVKVQLEAVHKQLFRNPDKQALRQEIRKLFPDSE